MSMDNTDYIIKVEHLRRDFQVGGETVHALRDVSFTDKRRIRAGRIECKDYEQERPCPFA